MGYNKSIIMVEMLVGMRKLCAEWTHRLELSSKEVSTRVTTSNGEGEGAEEHLTVTAVSCRHLALYQHCGILNFIATAPTQKWYILFLQLVPNIIRPLSSAEKHWIHCLCQKINKTKFSKFIIIIQLMLGESITAYLFIRSILHQFSAWVMWKKSANIAYVWLLP